MLQATNTELFAHWVPKAHNCERQNLTIPLQIKPVKVNLKLKWRIFVFWLILHPTRLATAQLAAKTVSQSPPLRHPPPPPPNRYPIGLVSVQAAKVQRSQKRFLRRFRSDQIRSLNKVKNELGPA